MKVFEFKNESSFNYAEDMKKILDYLNDVGTINPNISKKNIEKLYEKFSNEYGSVDWMVVNDNLLENFAQWLSGVEI